MEALAGVGDKTRGEWEDWTGKAFHVRRRLSEAEEEFVGPAIDIRGTAEARSRIENARRDNLHIPEEWAYEEAGLRVY